MRTIILALSWLSMAGFAFADISNEVISAYNKALADAASAAEIETASLNLAHEAAANPENKTAGLLAFETAWTLCRIGECAKGADAAKFAASQPVQQNDTDPSQEMRNVLASYITWKTDDSNANRKLLRDHLASLSPDDVSQVSLKAHKDHYIYCSNKRAWSDATQAAEAAAQHASAFKSELFHDYAEAELVRIATSFTSRPKVEQYEDALILTREIEQLILEERAQANAETDESASPLSDLHNRSRVWAGGIGAYLSSIRKTREVKRLDEQHPSPEALSEDTTDFCKGGFARPPRVRYPEQALNQRRFGSILIGFDVEDGETTNVRVLASVPRNIFDKEAIRAIKALRWSAAEGVDTSECSMDRRNLVYPITFIIRR